MRPFRQRSPREKHHDSLCEFTDALRANIPVDEEIDFTASDGAEYQIAHVEHDPERGMSRFRIDYLVAFSDIAPTNSYSLSVGERPKKNIADRVIILPLGSGPPAPLMTGAAAVRTLTQDFKAHIATMEAV